MLAQYFLMTLILLLTEAECFPPVVVFFFFLQHEASQEDEDTKVHEEDISLTISELPLEYSGGDILSMDMVCSGSKGDLDLDSFVPRYPL